MKIIFGTDGWRGLLDSEVNEANITLVAQAFADYSLTKKSNASIAVAYDGRKYSKLFAEIFSEVLSGNNILVHLSDSVVPTPLLSFYVKKNNFDSGVMITASHNPSRYNGVKFKANYGGPFFTEDTIEVEKLIGKTECKNNKLNIEVKNFKSLYMNNLERLIDFSLIAKNRKPLLIDSMGGAGAFFIEEILGRKNISAKTIFAPPSETFYNRSAEPIEKNLFPLKDALVDGEYTFGVANDGDADRIGLMDEKGNWIGAQETILLLADYIFTKKNINGNIVKTSSVTDKLKRYFENETRKVFDVQVGFKYITEEMIKGNVAFGCEESGGFGYGFHIPERDGIFSAFLFMEMLATYECDNFSSMISLLKNKYGEIFYARIDVDNHSENKLDNLEKILHANRSELGNWQIRDTKHFLNSRGKINGVKYYLEGGSSWLLIRVSETEPTVRFYAEGNSDHEVKNLLIEGQKLFQTL